MLIKRYCVFNHKVQEMDIPVTHERLDMWTSGGGLIQDIFPDLSPDQREFLLTGTLPGQWSQFIGEEDDAHGPVVEDDPYVAEENEE